MKERYVFSQMHKPCYSKRIVYSYRNEEMGASLMRRAYIVVLILLCMGIYGKVVWSREWSDVSGSFSVEADFVELSNNDVVLRKLDGTLIHVPLIQLSLKDQNFARSLAARSESTEESLTLVDDGEPVSVIVVKNGASERQMIAAAELQEHIRLMSGATIPILEEKQWESSPGVVPILVGRSGAVYERGVDTSTFDLETFVVKTIDGALLLVGDDGGSDSNPRFGTQWAVYDFLQDQLGCRWIWPGEIGQVVPSRTTIEIGPLDIEETPVVKVRGFRMTTQEKHRVAYESEGLGEYFDLGETYEQLSEDERVWLRRMRMGRSFKLSAGHAFTDWWEQYSESDPEIFAMQSDGRRRPKSSSRPDFVKMCVSNPRLWELQLESLRRYAAEGGRGLSLNACENDGSGGFCVCPRCRAWDTDPNTTLNSLPLVEDGSDVDVGNADGEGQGPSGPNVELPESLSDRYARWFNELAVRARTADPDSRIVTYAYSRYRSPPTQIDHIEPNVWIGYVGFNAYPRPEEYRRMSTDEWHGWSRFGPTVYLRSNSLFYFGEGAPLVATHQIAEDTRFQIDNGLRSTDYDCLQGFWATSGPSYYVLARMLWDTEADTESLIREYYESFGPMGPVVRAYFDYWEEFTTDLGDDPAFFELRRTDRMIAYPQFYTASVMAEARMILEQAAPLLGEASIAERERFRNIELGLRHGELLVDALEDGTISNGPEGETLMEFRREIAPRNVINVYWATSKDRRYHVFD
jgi:hypothetical protein